MNEMNELIKERNEFVKRTLSCNPLLGIRKCMGLANALMAAMHGEDWEKQSNGDQEPVREHSAAQVGAAFDHAVTIVDHDGCTAWFIDGSFGCFGNSSRYYGGFRSRPVLPYPHRKK